MEEGSRRDWTIGDQAVEALRVGLGSGLVAAVLFGSRARGDASPTSDWDLLVIARDLPARTFQRHLFLKRMLPPACRGAVSILAKTPDEFQARLPSLYLDIALDGHILYDVDGFAERSLIALRRLIRKSGLYRERTDAGVSWQWEKPPSGTWSLEWGQV